jgi:hypothetical protein
VCVCSRDDALDRCNYQSKLYTASCARNARACLRDSGVGGWATAANQAARFMSTGGTIEKENRAKRGERAPIMISSAEILCIPSRVARASRRYGQR